MNLRPGTKLQRKYITLTKRSRNRKIKVKKKEMAFHERTFSHMDSLGSPASTCKKRKYKRRSDFKFEEQSYPLCDITFTVTPKSSKSMSYKTKQNTNAFKHTPLTRAKKLNTSIKSHSLKKQKSKIENGSIEKLNHDVKSSSHCCQFQDDYLANSKLQLRPRKINSVKAKDSNKLVKVDTLKKRKSLNKNVYAEQINQDRKYKSCDQHNSYISLIQHTSIRQIEIEDQSESDVEEEMEQKHKQLEDVRRSIEESEELLFVHLKKERKCRIDKVIERFEKDTRDEIVDLKTMTILTESGKLEKLKSHHLHPRAHLMTEETIAMIKNLKKLHTKERELIKDLKKKKKFLKGSSKYSSQDSINKNGSFFNRFKPVDDLSEDSFSDISSDTDEAPVKLYSMHSNSNSLLNQSNLLRAESAIDSDESHVTLPLHSARDLATSQKFGYPNEASFKEKHSYELSSNSPPVLVNQTPVKCTFVRKAKSTRKALPEVSENSAHCISKSCFKTPTPFNSKLSQQFAVNSFNDSLIPRFNSDTSCALEETKNRTDQTCLLKNIRTNLFPSPQYSSDNALKSTKTNPGFSEKDVSSIELDSCSFINESYFASKSNFNVKDYFMNCSVVLERDDVLKYMNKDSVPLKIHYNSVHAITSKNRDSITDNCKTKSIMKKDYFKDMCNDFAESLPKHSSTDQPNASYDLSTMHSSKIKNSTPLKPKTRKLSSAPLWDRQKVESSIHKDCNDVFDTPTPKNISTVQQNASYKLIASQSASKNSTPLQEKSRKHSYALPLDIKKIAKSAHKNSVVTKRPSCTKRKRSDGDIDICLIAEFKSSPKPKQIPTRRHCNSTKKEIVKRNEEIYSNTPYDDLLM